MLSDNFARYKKAFRIRQLSSDSFVVRDAVVRKYGGGRGRKIKTLNIIFSTSYRLGQEIPAYAWMDTVCREWNEALLGIAIDERGRIDNRPVFALDGKSLRVTFKGSTLKISANMVERSTTERMKHDR
ncbi:MAG: hypothetical protein L3J16_07120 [Anaerolineales bacterium]|nr:hypothetical protein [Anaerolineales bacterium]